MTERQPLSADPDTFGDGLLRIISIVIPGCTLLIGLGGKLYGTHLFNNASIAAALSLLFAVAFVSGLVGLLAIGIHDYGRGHGIQGFWLQTLIVIRNTVVFLLLPCLLLSVIMVAIAMRVNGQL